MEPFAKTRADSDGTTTAWLKKHRLIYVAATRHPFILSIRDGTIDSSAFKSWLGQDYVFVRAFAPFVASVMVEASRKSDQSADMEVLLGGLASLNDEIGWFKKEAAKWGINLSEIVPQKPNLNYCRFLEKLMSPEVEYTVAMTALWAIETVYQKSFAHCLEDESKVTEELKETCERWGSEGFGEYCTTLQNIADRRLEMASIEELKIAEEAFLSVLELEVEFWNMSRGNSNPQQFSPATA